MGNRLTLNTNPTVPITISSVDSPPQGRIAATSVINTSHLPHSTQSSSSRTQLSKHLPNLKSNSHKKIEINTIDRLKFINILEKKRLTGEKLHALISMITEYHKKNETGMEIEKIIPGTVTDNIRPAIEKLFQFIGDRFASDGISAEIREKDFNEIIYPLSELGNQHSRVGASAYMSNEMYRLLAGACNNGFDKDTLTEYKNSVDKHFSKTDDLYSSPPIKGKDKNPIKNITKMMASEIEKISNDDSSTLKETLTAVDKSLMLLFLESDRRKGELKTLNKQINKTLNEQRKEMLNNEITSLQKDICATKNNTKEILNSLQKLHSEIHNRLSMHNFNTSFPYADFFSTETKVNRSDGILLTISRLKPEGKEKLFGLLRKLGYPPEALNAIDEIDKKLKRYS